MYCVAVECARRSGERFEGAAELLRLRCTDFGDFWVEEKDAFRENVEDLEVVELNTDSLCVVGDPLLVLGLVGVLLPPNMLPPLNRPPFALDPVERCISG